MSTDLNELGLNDEQFDAPVSAENVPEEIGGFELLYPGTYVFTLPKDLSGVWPDGPWERIETPDGQRVQAVLMKSKETDRDCRLMVKVEGKDKHFSIRLSNRPIGKLPSKLDSLLFHALNFKGTLKSNADYVKAIEANAGKSFIADVKWDSWDKVNKVAYSTRPWSNKDKTKGAKPVPRDHNGRFLQEFQSEEGVLLSCRAELENFRPAM